MDVPIRRIYCTMKRYAKLFHRVVRAADLPMDLDPHLFFVQWLGGNECMIEQHRGILSFAATQIRFLTEQGILTAEGEDLELEQMTASRAKVCGKIRSVSLEAKS